MGNNNKDLNIKETCNSIDRQVKSMKDEWKEYTDFLKKCQKAREEISQKII